MIYKDNLAISGDWYASVRYVDRNGIRHTDKRYGFETERDAFRWEAAFHLRRLSVPVSVLFDDILDMYCEVFRPRQIEKHVREYFTGVPASRITVEVVEDFWRYLQDYRYAGGLKGLSSYAKNHSLHQFYAIMETAVFCGNQEDKKAEKDLLESYDNTADALETTVWSREDYKEFSGIIRDEVPIYLASSLIFWTRIQPSDVRRIRVNDYDPGNHVLNVKMKTRKSDTDREAENHTQEYAVKPVSLPASYAEKLERYIHAMELEPEDYLLPISNDLMNFRLTFGAEAAGLPYIDCSCLYTSGLYSAWHDELTDIPEPPKSDTLVERRSSQVYSTASSLRDTVWLGDEKGQRLRKLWMKMMLCSLRDLRDIWQSRRNPTTRNKPE